MRVDLIVEDGTVVELANSYMDLCDLEGYAEKFLIDDQKGVFNNTSDAKKEWLLILATAKIDLEFRYYGKAYSSYNTTTPSVQPLGFPRSKLYGDRGEVIEAGTIPRVLKDAVWLLVREALFDDSIFDVSDESGGAIKSFATEGGKFDYENSRYAINQIWDTYVVEVAVMLRPIGALKDRDWFLDRRSEL